MKRIKRIFLSSLFAFICLFTFGDVCQAEANNLPIYFTISANKDRVNVGETVDVILNFSGATKNLGASDIVINYDSSRFEYVNHSKRTGFDANYLVNPNSAGEVHASISDPTGASASISDGLILAVTLRAKSTTLDVTSTFNYSVGVASDRDNKTYTINKSNSSKTVTIHVPSTNNNLSGLSLSNGTLSPSFSKSTTRYTSTINDSSVTINATKEDSNAVVTGAGNKPLNYGENVFNVLVTSESGFQKSYMITITRPDNRSSDCTLSSLTATNTDVKFTGSYAYSTIVSYATTNVNISATATDSRSSVTGLGNHSLKVGKNNISVKVTAENGTSRTYVITVLREDQNGTVANLSKNNYLSSLAVSGATFVFDKNTLDYEMTVPYAQNTLELNYTQEDANAIVNVIGSNELALGNNSVVVSVTAEDGTIRSYNLTIIRLEDKTVVANNKEAIITGIKGLDTKLTVSLTPNDTPVAIDSEIIALLQNTKKTLIYERNDANGILISSLTINGKDIKDTKAITPVITSAITNASLKTYLTGAQYMGISTNNSNIPSGSMYKYKVDANEDIYYLYSYVDNILVTKKLQVKDGYVEFEVTSNTDYALVNESSKIASTDNKKFTWVVPTLIVVVIGLIFAILGVIFYRKHKNNSKEVKVETDIKE